MSFIQWQFVDDCPQVQNVALSAAARVEALEEVLAQVGGKGRLPVVGLGRKDVPMKVKCFCRRW
jgi:hypothetical protein